jgi:hypothetical protein
MSHCDGRSWLLRIRSVLVFRPPRVHTFYLADGDDQPVRTGEHVRRIHPNDHLSDGVEQWPCQVLWIWTLPP